MDQDSTAAKGKKTIFITGFPDSVNEQELIQAFVTFGDKPRGFAFITFSNALDAQDAIDNYDMNELPGHEGRGKHLKVNLARPDTKVGGGAGGQKYDRPVWESEEWLQAHAKPLDESGGQGVQAALPPSSKTAAAAAADGHDVAME
ncbi:hypothetical protein QFC24_004352 [Naganishia onofrii]|uniref:Uncharacterized protein n=1 Tax=Naganishia onofrii TaxID=1851511 RepID=A0ACC2XDK6_9TREE|nr:hypothetical protein QFC24_004352 [Naganishia onofrii]